MDTDAWIMGEEVREKVERTAQTGLTTDEIDVEMEKEENEVNEIVIDPLLEQNDNNSREGKEKEEEEEEEEECGERSAHGSSIEATLLDVSAGSIALYPNPARGAVRIQLPQAVATTSEVLVFDTNGSLVARIEMAADQQIATLVFADFDLQSGIYHIKATSGDVVMTAKLAVIK